MCLSPEIWKDAHVEEQAKNIFNIDWDFILIGVFTVCIIKSLKVGDDGGGLLTHVICREASLIIPRCFDLNLKKPQTPPNNHTLQK